MAPRGILSVLFVCVGLVHATYGQTSSGPIRLVVGFGAGGLGDIVSRILADKLRVSLGTPVIVENMPGAGGGLAAQAVARSAPDARTLLLVGGQNAVSSILVENASHDLARDFAMVSTVGLFNFVILVGKDSPYKSVQDLIDAARRNPDRVNIGTLTFGTVGNLSALVFLSMAKLDVPTVPFKTAGQIQTALISGQIDAVFDTIPTSIGQLQSGNVRALAVSSKERLPYLPNVPTVAASGLPGYVLQSWNGYAVPAKTPREVVLKLNREIGAVVAQHDVEHRFRELGLTAHAGTPEEMEQFYKDDVVRWRAVIAGAKVQR